ncbi:MAG: nicotinate phosphoribosyltransferase [Thermomicrobiales bacterium]
MPLQPSVALETDLYHVDAAYIAWRNNLTDTATFDLYIRSTPFGGGFLLFAGLQPAIEYVEAFAYSASDIDFLRSLDRYDTGFLTMLSGLRFTGEILAFEEGDIAFPNEPLLRVSAPFIEALLIESGLLRAIGVSSLIATKAARMTLVARGASLADFSLRRAHNPFVASRASFIGGFHSTSFVDAARHYGIPATGTIPHALVQAFPDELTAFHAVTATFPSYSLLVDTYDLANGIRHAIEVGQDSRDHRLQAVRLDSGDLDTGSRLIRTELDAAGLTGVSVLVSGDIDEHRIDALLTAGAPIDGFGVGGNLGVGLGTVDSGTVGGVLGAVYKLAAYGTDASVARMKIAGDKSTLPGRKRPLRVANYNHDIIQLEHEPAQANSRHLLTPVMREGTVVYNFPTLIETRTRALDSLSALPPKFSTLTTDTDYPVHLSDELQQLTRHTVQRIESDNEPSSRS